jgi:hypothetical protein
MRRWRAGPRRALFGVSAGAVLGLSLSACGPPTYRYESSDANDLVLKVPRSWTLVRSGIPANSDGTAADPGNWLAVFDSASKPSLDHARSTHATSPVAVVRTLVVTKDEGSTATDNTLRDVLWPVSDSGRQAATLSGFTGTDFHEIADRTITTKAAHGVHVVYSYNLGEGSEVYDQVALIDAKKTRIHVLFVHCTQSCYDANRQEITSTMGSLTVKTP